MTRTRIAGARLALVSLASVLLLVSLPIGVGHAQDYVYQARPGDTLIGIGKQ
jgi:hypothetical protein